MAFNDPLHLIDTVNLETEKPVLPWPYDKSKDGAAARNEHERALGDRDALLLSFIRAIKSHGMANVSPQYPFTEDATLQPSQADCFDLSGDAFVGFSVDPVNLAISTSFLADLKLILSSEFRDPYLSTLTLRRGTDPNTGLTQIFVDLEFSARYSGDQEQHPILSLVGKAWNDVQDNTNPSSRDDVAFQLTVEPVAGRPWLNSGVVRFGFIGSVQSSVAGSWSIGTYNSATVEGFSSLPTLGSIVFTFPPVAAPLTELAYNLLGDLQNAIPFLSKIANYPFDATATAGQLLAETITEAEITGPAGVMRVFLKRIRLDSSNNYRLLFAYNQRDSQGNYLATINIGLAVVTPSSPTTVPIISLGSNPVAGVSPTWLDEVPTVNTIDNLGVGRVRVVSYAALQALFDELLATPVSVGSPSPIDVSPVAPVQIVGLYADPSLIEMIEDNSVIDTLAVDAQGVLVSTYNRPPGIAQATRNVQVSIGGVLVNRRTVYGAETLMRDFYGIGGTESLTNNPKIPLDDQWYNPATNSLQQYQIVQGVRKWRSL